MVKNNVRVGLIIDCNLYAIGNYVEQHNNDKTKIDSTGNQKASIHN